MNSLIHYIRRKLSIRVSLWVVLFAALIFVGALSFLFYQAREAIRQEAINHATQILDKTSLRVEGILNRAEVATQMTEWLVQRHPDKADSMFVYSRGMLQNNPDFYNCSIAFEPYHFKDKGRYFSAYSLHEGDSIRTIQGGSDSYQYFYMDWYLMAKLSGHACWTEPYMDFDAPTNSYGMVTSYCMPVKNRKGKVIGVVNTSLSLNWLSQTISEVKPYPNSYSIMIGRGGTYFVHPDTTKIACQTIFTQTIDRPDTALTALGHAMQAGREGMKRMSVDGRDCYVFYKPLGKTGCSMAIICPESDIFGGFDRVRRAVSAIVCIGLMLMLYLFVRIITRELMPLRVLAKGTKKIASGHFDAQLPDLQRIDEIGQLSHSFADMQQSLVKYIKELKITTAQKASIDADIRIASNIQMAMVPNVFPEREGLDMFASMVPAKEVGGDLYSYVLRGDNLYFCVGDVSGKGVPASLFMAQSARLFHILAVEDMEPADIAARMNDELSEGNDNNMFVTMFIGLIHLDTGRLDFCNCGHNAPVIDGRFLGMTHVNQPIGVMEGLPFRGESFPDIRGHQLLVYTDGLTEAENPQQELFGDARLIELMADAVRLNAREVIDMLKKAVEQHRSGAEPSDDLTLMCITVKN